MNTRRGAVATVGGLAVTMALLATGCRDVTQPRVGSSGAPTPTFSHVAFGNDFFQYPVGALLHDHGWTRIVGWPSSGQQILGDWRAKDGISGSLGASGRAVQLENPPVDGWDVRVIRWDTLSATLGPPVDILAHLWIPPTTKYPRVGVAWFIQEPDGTPTCLGAACGEVNAFAVVRNMLATRDDGFSIVRHYNDVFQGIWPGTENDRLKSTWVWMRVQHTISGESGTIRFRVWKGTRANEPSQWDAEQTSTWFGPNGGDPGPAISGKAGLLARGHPNMAGAQLYWDMFAVSNDIVPCDGTVTTIISEYQQFQINLQPTCSDFATAGGTINFSWSMLNDDWSQGNTHEPWGMITQALLDGLEATRTNYNRGEILLTSGYRCPHGNNSIPGAAAQSLHMHGAAADMYSADHGGQNWTEAEFNLLKAAADATVPPPRQSFPWNEYPDHHYHAAW